MTEQWMAAAECSCAGDVMLLPETRQRTVVHRHTATAVAICTICPVKAECRTWACAGDNDPVPAHIAGGLTPRQREQVRRQRRGPDWHGHGTTYGYNQHYRQGTPVCAPCRAAHHEHKLRYRQATA